MMAVQAMMGQTVKVESSEMDKPFQGKIIAVGYNAGGFDLLLFTDKDGEGKQYLRHVQMDEKVQVQTIDTPDIAVARQAGSMPPPGGALPGMPPGMPPGGRRPRG